MKVLILLLILVTKAFAQKPAAQVTKKPKCIRVSSEYFKAKFDSKEISYSQYFDMITSRKIKIEKKQTLDSIVENDVFTYSSIEKGKSYIRKMNGLRSDKVKAGKTILLPFCIDPETAARDSQKTKLKISDFDFLLGASLGKVDIRQSSDKFSMNVTKLFTRVSYKLKSHYIISGQLSAAQFSNITQNNSSETTDSNSIYPEYGLQVSKIFPRWTGSLAYDSLNYFTLKSSGTVLRLDPNRVNRLSIRPGMTIYESFEIGLGLGYLKSFGSENLNGFDYSVSAGYNFGNKKRFNLSAYGYQSNVKFQQDQSYESSSVGISLAYKFQ